MTLEELKTEILCKDPEEFVDEYIINSASEYFSEDQLSFVLQDLSSATGVNIRPEEIVVVGSAKLGYGLFEKKRMDERILPAFRPFDGDSDIDIAFASPELFDVIWNEIANYARAKSNMPHRMNKLGDYMVYGWIRPDHIPRDARLRTFDLWNDRVRRLAVNPKMKRRKISGALYRDLEFLKKYQARGISACKTKLELK